MLVTPFLPIEVFNVFDIQIPTKTDALTATLMHIQQHIPIYIFKHTNAYECMQSVSQSHTVSHLKIFSYFFSFQKFTVCLTILVTSSSIQRIVSNVCLCFKFSKCWCCFRCKRDSTFMKSTKNSQVNKVLCNHYFIPICE